MANMVMNEVCIETRRKRNESDITQEDASKGGKINKCPAIFRHAKNRQKKVTPKPQRACQI